MINSTERNYAEKIDSLLLLIQVSIFQTAIT